MQAFNFPSGLSNQKLSLTKLIKRVPIRFFLFPIRRPHSDQTHDTFFSPLLSWDALHHRHLTLDFKKKFQRFQYGDNQLHTHIQAQLDFHTCVHTHIHIWTLFSPLTNRTLILSFIFKLFSLTYKRDIYLTTHELSNLLFSSNSWRYLFTNIFPFSFFFNLHVDEDDSIKLF